MRVLDKIRLRLRSLFRVSRVDTELQAEFDFHLDQLVEEKIAAGMAPRQARLAARREIGGITRWKEECRDMRRVHLIEDLVRDLQYTVRSLAKTPVFTAVAVATLVVGIGVNATVFTVTSAALFRGFPQVPENGRLLYVSDGGCCISYPDFEDIRRQAASFSSMGITHGIGATLSDGSGYAERVEITEISSATFHTTGAQPVLGRDFTAADEAYGATPVTILNHDFWKRRYGADPSILNQSIRLNGIPTTIVGIMPEGFSFPQAVDVWVPLVKTPQVMDRNNTQTWFAFGRLADGVSWDAAKAETETIIQHLEEAYPLAGSRRHLAVQTFQQFFVGPNAPLMYFSMWAAVGFVLLIACANLANLVLVRAAGRAREISVRIALGVPRGRIIRQVLAESLLLSGAGGALGWWLAGAGVRVFQSVMAQRAAGLILDYSMDRQVLAYLILISVATGVVFGLAPALRLSRMDVNSVLKDGGQGSTTGRGGRRIAWALVAGELALSIVLLAGAGVMIRSFLKVRNAGMGVEIANVLGASIDLPSRKSEDPSQVIAYFDRVEQELAGLKGGGSVAIADVLPSWYVRQVSYEIPGEAVGDPARRRKMQAMKVGPGYFGTLRARVLAGRDFHDGDNLDAAPVAIVNQALAEGLWLGEDPLGKRIHLFSEPNFEVGYRDKSNDTIHEQGGGNPASDSWVSVIGVVSNIVQNDERRQREDPILYLPFRQQPDRSMWILTRTEIPPSSLAQAVRRRIGSVDADLPVYGPFPLIERLELYWDSRFYGSIFLVFAAIALLLSSVGLYTVIAHAVNQRTAEIGIRVAVGASKGDVLRLVFRQAMRPLAIGLAVGLVASLAVNRVLEAELIQVSPGDPLTLAVSAVVLIVAAMLGCWIPARRALRVDPGIALRHE